MYFLTLIFFQFFRAFCLFGYSLLNFTFLFALLRYCYSQIVEFAHFFKAVFWFFSCYSKFFILLSFQLMISSLLLFFSSFFIACTRFILFSLGLQYYRHNVINLICLLYIKPFNSFPLALIAESNTILNSTVDIGSTSLKSLLSLKLFLDTCLFHCVVHFLLIYHRTIFS